MRRHTPVEGVVVHEPKLLAPAPRPGWVDRPALAYELDRGASARLTLVSAPVGSGKSTLLAQWAAASYDRDVAWLTLDRGDDSPTLFWTYVVSALRTVRPGFGGQVLRRLRAPGIVVEDDVLPLLSDAIAELDRVTIVLDDFQTITHEDVHDGLLYLIERLPPGVRIVVATQADPPLPLDRLRTEGELHEVRDLGLSADQTAALLRTVLPLELAPDDVRAVHEWTEGWAAGVQLAALSASGQPDPRGFLSDLPANAQLVVDYVWDEVLARQRADVRRFLAETSILDRFSAPLCAAVTGRDDAEQLLSELERSNAFLVTLDASSRWYRFHQVFRDVLARDLAALSPTDVADLHRRASEWYAKEGLIAEAIEHAVVAGDVQYASDQLILHWLSLYSEGRGYRIVDWLDRFPPDVFAADPGLCLLAANLFRSFGRRDEVERWLAVVEAAAPLDAQLQGFAYSTGAAVAINRSMLALADGDAAAALAEALRAEEAEADPGALGRVVASFFVGVVLFFADDASAELVLEGFLADPRTADQHARAYAALAFLSSIALDKRDVGRALGLAEEALERAHAHGLDEYPQTSLVHGAMGDALLENGHVERAEEHLEQAVTLARRGREGCDIALALLALARLRVRQLDQEAARDAVTAARDVLEVAGLPRITRQDRELSRLLLRTASAADDVAAAAEALTDDELRVLRLLPYDLAYPEIAARLGISPNALRTHARHIRHKLEVASRSEAVTAARRRGLL
jgi:LuxR family maltose regulon positive regulatory protein